MRDNVSFSLVKFFIIFRHWARMFRSPHFFSAWLSKFHSPPPLEHFEHKNYLKKKSSLRFRTWKETFSALCEKHSRRGCQPQSTSSQGSFGGKYFIENVFFSVILFGPWLKHSRFLSEKFQPGYQYAFYVSKKRVWKRTKREVDRKLFEFGRKICAGFVKTSSLMFMRTVWTENFFGNNFNFQKSSYTKRENVRLLPKVNWPSGENCILRVHWKNMGIKIWADFFPDTE